MATSPPRWLLLIHQVPPKPDYLRVKVRRRLQQIGAVAVKSTVYVLPTGDQSLEDFEWVLREIIEAGGQGAICEAGFVGGLSEVDVEALFRAERASDYESIAIEAGALLGNPSFHESRTEVETALARLRKRHDQVRSIDYLGAPEASVAESLLREIQARLDAGGSAGTANKKEKRVSDRPVGKTWVTRKGVYIDRIASAWLIRRFIDPKAKFKFVPGRGRKPAKNELRFDMFEGEYTHEGQRCTFEVLLERFALRDPALLAIAEVIHDLDIKDEKFQRPETTGIEQVIAGIAMTNKEDSVRIERGSAVFDDLYAYLSRKTATRKAKGGKR
ncbi:MAG: chromate resistance protein [Planctomycetes bacterium]|nr:chromate resistance protein [Planctomycetota bacterium]